jgi:hypothetical protein
MFHWAYPATLTDDSAWGTATLRQRVILRLEALAKAVDEYGQRAALGETAGTAAGRLRARLAVEDAQLPAYPAFHG